MVTTSFEIRVLKDESHPFFIMKLSSFGQKSLHLRYTLLRIRKFFSSNANFHLKAAGLLSSFPKTKHTPTPKWSLYVSIILVIECQRPFQFLVFEAPFQGPL